MSLAVAPLQIINDDGRKFYIRLVRKNQAHGIDNALLHQHDEPLVEFFDASAVSEDDEDFGYYTGIRCNISTLFTTAFERGGAADTLYNESLPMWNISNDNLGDIRDWLLRHLHPAEKSLLGKAGQHAEEQRQDLATSGSCGVPPPPPAKVTPLPQLTTSPPPEPAQPPAATGFSDRLRQALALLDQAEPATPGWREGRIGPRLHLLDAKKHLLQALALLDNGTDAPD